VLTRISNSHSKITSRLPYLYKFSDGESGNYIVNGGDDLFNGDGYGGNYIILNSLKLADALSYADDYVKRFSLGNFFTKKVEGLFVLAADATYNP
jgi:hypothetical protein